MSSATLKQKFFAYYYLDQAFLNDLDAACLPEVTEEEAVIFAQGDPERIAALLIEKPHLQPIEDFLGAYLF